MWRSVVTIESFASGDPNLGLLYGPLTAHPVAASLLGISYMALFALVLSKGSFLS